MEEENKKNTGSIRVVLLCAVFLFVASAVFTGLNVSHMRTYELTCYKTIAVVIRLTTERVHSNTRYRFTYAYITEDGVQREIIGKNAITQIDPERVYVGEEVEIYVDTTKNEAIPVANADLFSIISVTIFAFAVICYVVGSAMLLHCKGYGLKHRLLVTWLPIMIICIATVLLFWIGVPNGTFSELFLAVGGAVGYSVIAGLTCIVTALDILISKKLREKV